MTMTKVEKFTAIAKALEGVTVEGFDAQAFIQNEITLTQKKNAKRATSKTKTQKENDVLIPQVIEFVNNSDGVSATEVANALGLGSTQKATALLKKAVDAKAIIKDKVKGKTVFMAISTEAD